LDVLILLGGTELRDRNFAGKGIGVFIFAFEVEEKAFLKEGQ